MNKTLKRILVAPLFLIAFVIVVIEDEIWQRAIILNERWLKQNKYLLALESASKTWSVWKCFSLFLIPLIVLFPIKLAAMFMISKGHLLTGGFLFLSIKFIGAALSAKIYTMTEKTLRTLAWFAKFVDYVSNLRKKMTGWIIESKTYVFLKEKKKEFKDYLSRYKKKTKSRVSRLITKIKYLIKKK